MSRHAVLTWGLLALLLALAAWMWPRLESVTVQRWRGATGEAASDPYYGLERIAKQTQVPLKRMTHFDALPDVHTTLVLDTEFWDLLPDKVDRLRRWVERGGQLVVLHGGQHPQRHREWMPYDAIADQDLEAPADDEEEEAANRPRHNRPQESDSTLDQRARQRARAQASEEGRSVEAEDPWSVLTPKVHHPDCPDDTEQGPEAPWWPGSAREATGAAMSMSLCGSGGLRAPQGRTLLWALGHTDAPSALRIQVGRGTVTRVEDRLGLLRSRYLREEARARAMAAVLQWRAHHPVWIVSGETRDDLARWLWTRFGPALLVWGLAVLAYTWQRAVRLGPLLAPPPLARRSMAEQIKGTAAFLLRHRSMALHRASVQALRQQAWRWHAATRRMPDEQLWPLIAQATQVDAKALAQACGLHEAPRSSALGAALLLIESTRRRLAQNPKLPTPDAATSPSDPS